MSNLIALFFRKTIKFFMFGNSCYLIGMVLVRTSRVFRKWYFDRNKNEELVRINNFIDKVKMDVDKNSYMGGSIYWSGFHHITELYFLKKFLKPEMNFVDIGANQGEFSLFVSSFLSKGKVFSFEPVSKNLRMLNNNITISAITNIEVFPYGLSNEVGEFAIYTSLDKMLHHGRHEGLSTLYKSDVRSEFEETVKLKVFDNEFSLERLDFIKIDIEGAELFALKGMVNHLKKFKPAIMIEMNAETFTSAGYSLKEMSDFFSELGYKPFKIYRGNLFEIGDNNEFSDWGNYIFKA